MCEFKFVYREYPKRSVKLGGETLWKNFMFTQYLHIEQCDLGILLGYNCTHWKIKTRLTFLALLTLIMPAGTWRKASYAMVRQYIAQSVFSFGSLSSMRSVPSSIMPRFEAADGGAFKKQWVKTKKRGAPRSGPIRIL